MKLAFILTMPGCPSWNGRWSGEGSLYARVQNFTTKKQIAKAEELKQKGYFSYGWSDGWRAGIQVKEVDAVEARKINKKSQGFCGYDWMIASILKYGTIYATHEEPKEAVTA